MESPDRLAYLAPKLPRRRGNLRSSSSPNHSHQCRTAAKAAVAHYTRKLAHDLAPHGATANAIAPGYIASGQFRARFGKNDEAVLQDIAKLVPLGRLGTPEDCANVVEFLSTSLSDYVTGQVIAVDGGVVRGPC